MMLKIDNMLCRLVVKPIGSPPNVSIVVSKAAQSVKGIRGVLTTSRLFSSLAVRLIGVRNLGRFRENSLNPLTHSRYTPTPIPNS